MSVKLTARLTGGSGGTVTKIVEIVLPAANWYGGENTWAQIIDLPEASPFSKIDLQPNAEQAALLYSTAFLIENAEGIITVYALGDKPETDIAMQASLTEVVREKQGVKICGDTIGRAISVLYPKSDEKGE